MDDQEMHDLEMAKRPSTVSPGSRQRLEALLAEKGRSSSTGEPYYGIDPIEQAIRDNPGLTREMAMETAEKLGLL